MASQPLLIGAQLTLDSNGAGTLLFGPVPNVEQWNITTMSVTTSGPNTKQALVQVYRNTPSIQAALIDGTYSGNFDTSACDITLDAGERLYIVWSGGNANAAATYRIEGTRSMAANVY